MVKIFKILQTNAMESRHVTDAVACQSTVQDGSIFNSCSGKIVDDMGKFFIAVRSRQMTHDIKRFKAKQGNNSK